MTDGDANLEQFFADEYAIAAEEFVSQYPAEKSFWIEWSDLNDYAPDFAESYLEKPDYKNQALKRAFRRVVDEEIGSFHIRVTDEERAFADKGVSDIKADDLGQFVAITGQLSNVTAKETLITEIGYECADCGAINREPQKRHSTSKPNSCNGCDDGSYFNVIPHEMEKVDLRRLKLETPPDDAAQGEGTSTTVCATDDLCDYGGANGLPDRAGEKCTVLAERRFVEEDLFGNNGSPTPRTWLEAQSIVFHDDTNEGVDIDAHMTEISECMNHDDPVTYFRDNIVPALEADEDFEAVLDAATAWAFGAYRVEVDEATYRGDLHFGLIGDPGTGKSTLLSELHRICPISEFRSGTGLTEVGLTAAAVHEEFAGESKWTLEPGILPRANGGHCIIDEVDDVLDGETKAIHDALEGDQMVKVDKAGITADLETRTALLASGNPEKGRFDPYEPIPEQIDLDAALIDRMDILLDLQDAVDRETDEAKAEHYIESYDEVSRKQLYENGELDVEPDMNTANRDIEVEVMRAWVAYARQNIFPVLTEPAKADLKQFYLDARNLNGGYDESDSDAIPVTPRTLGAGIRISTALARCEGSETVEPEHVERAKKVTQRTIGLNWDPATGEFDAGKTDTGNLSKHGRMLREIGNVEGDEPADWDDVVAMLTEEFNMTAQKAEHEISTLMQKGDLYEPRTGQLRVS